MILIEVLSAAVVVLFLWMTVGRIFWRWKEEMQGVSAEKQTERT